MTKAAIIQSSYIPWKGYFDIIHDADVFVFLEDVQYTKGSWRNRNKVKTPAGVKWLTVPTVGGIHQQIRETRIDYHRDWADKHKKTIYYSYSPCEYFASYKDDILGIFDRPFDTISDLNIYAIKKLSSLLGLDREFLNSCDLKVEGRKDDKVIGICRKVGADHYISGPAARDYITDEKFEKAEIRLEYKSYDSYPEYGQRWGEFDHFISIIDLLFNCGEKAPYYIWGWRDGIKPG